MTCEHIHCKKNVDRVCTLQDTVDVYDGVDANIIMGNEFFGMPRNVLCVRESPREVDQELPLGV